MTEPIDLGHLEQYVFGDRALLDEILSIFIDQAAMLSRRLLETADDETWRETAHTLKGAARGVGAWSLGDLAERAEKAQGSASARAEIAAEIAVAARAATEFARAARDKAA